MTTYFRFIFLYSIGILFANHAIAQSANSNIGTEFWTAYMDHSSGIGGVNGSEMVLYIASATATSGNVTLADGSFTKNFTVVPNQVTIFSIPSSAFIGNVQGVVNKGIHIVANDPVAIYAHIYANSVSGAALLLPVNTLATDYYSLNYKQQSNTQPAYSTFMVVATDNNTTVQIVPSVTLLDGKAANVPFTVTLQKGEVYQALSATDLTGTHIMSVSNGQGCKKIAVFSGSSKIFIGRPNITSDNLFQQVYPTASWGKSYITVPLKSRNYDIFRIILSDPSTSVTLNGNVLNSSSLINNLYYEFNSQTTNVINADKPIQVVQYAVTQSNGIIGQNVPGDVGDPEMIFLNPLEQNIDNVTLFSTNRYAIENSYINVVIPSSSAGSFLLDGNKPAQGFLPVPGNSNYLYAQFAVSTGLTHNIAAGGGFNAVAYGFGAQESYGYAAGTNLKNLNEYVQFINQVTNQVTLTGCVSNTLVPEIILPYQTNNISWDLGLGSAPIVQNNPGVKTTIQKNSQTLYVYDCPSPVNYPQGIYPIKVTVFDPFATSCGSSEEIDLSFTVYQNPVANFSSRNITCVQDTIGFQNLTTSSRTLASWHWDFGNGDTSAVKNPVYSYNKPGDYNVTLTATSMDGCPASISKTVHINNPPTANFNIEQPACQAPHTVTFHNTSTTTEGTITSWSWNFGDGSSTLSKTDGLDFTHSFSLDGSYNVMLTIGLDNGCTASFSKTIVISPNPKSDFIEPDYCLGDGVAHIRAIANADSTTNRYFWDFGDVYSPQNLNTATGINASHQYIKTGSYAIKLKIITKDGCETDTVKQFTVNGSFPKAAFTIVNPNNLCSNSTVFFVTNANVPRFGNGKITSFTMDFGDGTANQTFRLDSGSVFTHKYPTQKLNTATYTVTMHAYSGQTCFDIQTQNIQILPIPSVDFNPPSSICQSSSPLPLSNFVNHDPNSSLNGATFTFTVDGVVSTLLDPKTLGSGSHDVICYATSTTTSCIDTIKSQIIVDPAPTLSAGPSQIILAGGQIQLQAKSAGVNNLTYHWTPSTGLDNPNILDPIASPSQTTRYTVTASSANGLGCTISDTLTVKVLQKLSIPNAFTPNGDGINDSWNIKYLNSYPDCSVEIFNRYGQKVFFSIGYNTPWNGKYNGGNLPAGVYYYLIDPKQRGLSILSGYITIIR